MKLARFPFLIAYEKLYQNILQLPLDTIIIIVIS